MKNRYILLLFTLFFVVTGSVAQDGAVIVSGTVYDKAGNNETFPGVNIICRDAKTQKRIRGTASDLEGGFSIKVPVGSELVFTYVSYKPTIYKVKKSVSGISIFLEENINEVQETVIVGQRRVSKANLTASATVIDAKEVKAENGSVRTYRLNVVRQSDAPVANVPSGGENAQSSGGNTSGPGSTGNVVIIRPSGQGNSPESQSADVVIGVSPS